MTDRFLPRGESNQGSFEIKVRYHEAPDGWVEELYRALQAVIRERQGEAGGVYVSVEVDASFGRD